MAGPTEVQDDFGGISVGQQEVIPPASPATVTVATPKLQVVNDDFGGVSVAPPAAGEEILPEVQELREEQQSIHRTKSIAAGFELPPEPMPSPDEERQAAYLRWQSRQTKLNPENAAETLRIAAATGHPIQWVADNLESLKKEQEVSTTNWKELAQQHPALAKFMLDDPVRHALVKDDVANLQGLQYWLLGRWEDVPSTPEEQQAAYQAGVQPSETTRRLVAAPVWAAKLRDAIKAQELIYRQAKVALSKGTPIGQPAEGEWLGSEAQVAASAPPMVRVPVEDVARIVELQKQGVGVEKDYGEGARKVVGRVFLAPFEMAPMIAGNVVATVGGTSVGGPPGGLAAAIAFNSYQNFGPLSAQLAEITDEQGNKIDPNLVRNYALAASLAGGTLMSVGLGPTIKRLPGAQQALERITTQTAAKALTTPTIRDMLGKAALHYGLDVASGAGAMAMQTVANASARELARTESDPSYKPDWDAVAREAADEFPRAVESMLVLAGTSAGSQLMRDRGQRLAAVDSANRLRALTDGANSSKLLKLAPAEAEQLLVSMREQAGLQPGASPDTVYVDREGWNRYWQEQKIDPRAAAVEVIGDGGKAYDAAHGPGGGDLEIPMEKYLVRLATAKNGEHARALAPDLKLSADVNTPRQETAEMQRRATRLQELAKIEPDQMELARQRVYEEYRLQAMDAGQGERVASDNAKLYSASLQTLAERAGRGETAWDLWQANRLTIRGPEAAPAEGGGMVPEASRLLAERFQKMTPEERAREVYIDTNTGLLNERAFNEMPPNPEKPFVGHVSVEGTKWLNDQAGHGQGDRLYQMAAKTLHDIDPQAAKVKGDFAVRVKDQGELDAIVQLLNESMAVKGFSASGVIGETFQAAGEAHGAWKAAEEKAGRRSERGMKPKGVTTTEPGKVVFPAERATAAVPEALAKRHVALSEREAFHAAYIEPIGILTSEGWNGIPRKEHLASVDLNGLKYLNEKLGTPGGDAALLVFGRLAAEHGGETVDFAHLHGDEYAAQSNNPAELQAFFDRLQTMSDNVRIEVRTPDGKIQEIQGLQFGRGIGRTNAEAETALSAHKKELTAAGLRGSEVDARRIREAGNRGNLPGWGGPLAGAGRETRPEGYLRQGFAGAPEAPRAGEFRFDEGVGGKVVLEQAAYHGSPHHFDRFTLEHIGTGEGAQSFGWGLYFAGEKQVAEYYRRELTQPTIVFGRQEPSVSGGAIGIILERLQEDLNHVVNTGGNRRGLREVLLRHLKEYLLPRWEEDVKNASNENDVSIFNAWAEGARKILKTPNKFKLKGEGQLYKVDIPSDSQFMSYDELIDKQPAIAKKLNPIRKSLGENITGAHVYAMLENDARADGPLTAEARKITSDPHEAASRTLATLGIPGMRYLDSISRAKGKGSHNYVLWNDRAIKNLTTLYQEGRGGSRGYVQFQTLEPGKPASFDLRLLSADQSTLAHESFHILSQIMGQLASREDAPMGIRADYDRLLKEMGYASHEERLKAPEASKEEKASHLWEMYLAEGRPPAEGLRYAFQRFKGWMLKIYQGIQGIAGQYREKFGEDLQLSDEVRGIFDRLLASQTEMERLQTEFDPHPLFEVAGLSTEERVRYQELDDQAREAAQTELVRHAAEDARRSLKEAEAEGEHLRAAAADTLNQDPAYRALSFLQTGELRGMSEKVLHTLGLSGPTGIPLKLDRKALISKFGEEAVKALPRGIFARGKEALGADEMASKLGFDDGQAFIDAIRGKNYEGALKDEIKRRVEEKYGPALLDDPAQLRGVALDAIHTEEGAKKLFLRLSAMARQLDPSIQRRLRGMTPQAMRSTADALLLGKPIGKISAERYANSERAAAERASQAWAEGRKDKAWEATEEQLWHHVFYRAARDLREQLDGALADLKGSARSPWRSVLGKADPAYRDVHDQLLEAVGLARPPEPMRDRPGIDTLVAKATADAQDLAFDVEGLRDLLTRPRPWRELTTEEALNLRDAVKSIRHLANDRNEMLLSGRRISRLNVIEEATKTAEKALPEQPKLPRDPLFMDTIGRNIRLAGQSIDALLDDIQTIAHFLDGGNRDGIFHKIFIDERLICRDKRSDLTRKFLAVIEKGFEKSGFDRKQLYERIDVSKSLPLSPELARTWQEGPVTRANLLMMLLNLGNESNRERFLGGYGWEFEQVKAALEKHLNAKELRWVQDIWDALEGFYPEMAKVHEEETGLAPGKIIATPFEMTSADGEKVSMKGGYFPAKYDPRPGSVKRTGERQVAEDVADFFQGNYTRAPSVRASHAKERAAHFEDLVNLNWGVVPAHVSQVIQDISYRKYVKQTAALLLDSNFRNLMVQRLGEERAKVLRPWLQAVANLTADTVPDHLRLIDRFWSGLKSRAAIASIGWSIPVALGDLTNPLTAVSAGLVSPKYLALAMAKQAGSWKETRQFAREHFSELRDRSENLAQKYRRAMAEMGGPRGRENRFMRGVRDSAFVTCEIADHLTSTPVATARYLQSLAEGKTDAQAVRDANDVLRKILPPHDVADQPAILRDRRALGSLLMFYGYANKIFNLERTAAHDMWTTWRSEEAGLSDKAGAVAKFAGTVLAVSLVNGVIGEYMSGRGKEQNETTEEWLERKLVAALFYPIPFAGAAGDWIAGKFITGKAKPLSLRQAPALSFIQDTTNKIGQAFNDWQNGDDDAGAAAMSAAEFVAGVTLGAPTRQAHKTLGYLKDLVTGETAPRGPFDVLSGTVFGENLNGQPANPLIDIQDIISGQ